MSLLSAHDPSLGWGLLPQTVQQRIEDQPTSLSPWLYLGYYELGKVVLSDLPVGSQARQRAFTTALALAEHGLAHDSHVAERGSPAQGPTVVAFGDSDQASPQMWTTLLAVLQEGGDFVEDLSAPSALHLDALKQEIQTARRLIALVDPDLHGLMLRLQRLLVLAIPGPRSQRRGESFGGVTAFFFRGASVLNASLPRSLAATVEVLVHEYAHGELFALGQEQVLCLNRDEERHQVLIRADPRPMHGILHSLHVVSRVIGVIDTILSQPPMDLLTGPEDLAAFQQLREQQLAQGLSSLAVVREHARLTPIGEVVVDAAAQRLERCGRGTVSLPSAVEAGTLQPVQEQLNERWRELTRAEPDATAIDWLGHSISYNNLAERVANERRELHTLIPLKTWGVTARVGIQIEDGPVNLITGMALMLSALPQTILPITATTREQEALEHRLALTHRIGHRLPRPPGTGSASAPCPRAWAAGSARARLKSVARRLAAIPCS